MDTQGVVVDNVANLYSKPSREVDVVTQAILGTSFSIAESGDGWHHVRLPDQYQGWIETPHVRVYARGEAPYASTGQVAEIEHLLAFLYDEPHGSSRAPALQVTIGARLEVEEEREDWVQVVLPDRTVRWVRRGDVVISRADNSPRPRRTVEQVISTAKRFLGLPYLWSGTTPLGIDCSGFVQLVYRLNGVALLRDSNIQYTQPGLNPVDKGALQAGDLVFFGRESITHVGMYIGDGEFIHATAHLKPIVQISRLDETHWTDLYQGARRP
jgi:cell wall-associated NlpC family hydrolase